MAQEHRNAELLGGRRQPASGRLLGRPRDNLTAEFLVETRFTDRRSYSIRAEEWDTLETQARRHGPGYRPAMQIDIGQTKLFVLALDDKIRLQERVAGLEDALRELGVDPHTLERLFEEEA